MSNVVPLIKRSASFYTIAKNRNGWTVVLVTPTGGKAHRTAVEWLADRASAIVHGRATASRMLMTFRLPRQPGGSKLA